MGYQEKYFKTLDCHRLYYQEWEPTGRVEALLVFVHGLNEHSGRYHFPINFFLKRGYKIVLFDHRGHGRSDGLRGFVDDFGTYMKDLEFFVEMIRNEEGRRKVFVIGHSMGGQIVINYVARCKPKIDGFITSSANIRTSLKVPWLKKKMALWLSHCLPRLSILNEIDPRWISRDVEVVRQYKEDPLVPKKITLKLAAEILKNQATIEGLAGRVHIPALIMHGGADKICDPEGSRCFYSRLASTDKALKIYEGFYHEIFNEQGKERVFRDMDEWLKRHL